MFYHSSGFCYNCYYHHSICNCFVLQYFSVFTMVTMAPTLIGLPATSGQYDLDLPPLLMPKYTIGVVGLTTVLQQQPQSQMPLQAYANYAMGPPKVCFSFRVELLTNFLKGIDICSGVCFLLSSNAECHIHQWGLNHWGLHHCSLLEHTHIRHICSLVMVIGPC